MQGAVQPHNERSGFCLELGRAGIRQDQLADFDGA